MRRKEIICLPLVALMILCTLFSASAQSKEFKLGKNLESQYEILKALQAKFVDTVNVEKIVATGIDAMLSSLDPYTVFIPSEEQETLEMMTTSSYGGMGSSIRKYPEDSLVTIIEPYYMSPAAKSGLEPGDKITHINGVDVKPFDADKCSKMLRGTPGTELTLNVIKGRSGQKVVIKPVREKIHFPDVTWYGMLNDTTGYIRLSGFTVNGSAQTRSAVVDLKAKGARRMVLDLRNNPGGLLDEAVKTLSIFLPKGTKVVTQKGRDESEQMCYITEETPVDTLMPLMVMVNSSSASSSEIVTGAIQDLDRGFIAGERTYGKGLVQGMAQLPYNGVLKLTIAKYYTPSGRCVQAIDYSNRREDGSVGTIPDSLKREFKTLVKGRSVWDGGGIAPDSTIKDRTYARVVYSLVGNAVIDDFAIQFYKDNDSIASPSEFKVTDDIFNKFVEFASGKEFDFRSASLAKLENVIKDAKTEGLYDGAKEYFDNLKERLTVTKEEAIRNNRETLAHIIGMEIVAKYHYSAGEVEYSVKEDVQLRDALKVFLDLDK